MRGTFLGSALLLDGYIEGDPGSFVVREDRNDEIVFHESMVIGGHLYEDVVQLRKPWETSIPEQVPTFWIARGIGIVQFEQYDEALGNRRTFRLKE